MSIRCKWLINGSLSIRRPRPGDPAHLHVCKSRYWRRRRRRIFFFFFWSARICINLHTSDDSMLFEHVVAVKKNKSAPGFGGWFMDLRGYRFFLFHFLFFFFLVWFLFLVFFWPQWHHFGCLFDSIDSTLKKKLHYLSFIKSSKKIAPKKNNTFVTGAP